MLSLEGWWLLDQTVLLQNQQLCHLFLLLVQPPWPTPCRSPTASCCAHCSGTASASTASPLEHTADFSTAKLSLHHHRGGTATTFTANLVRGETCLCRLHVCKQRSIFQQIAFLILFSSKFICGTLASALPIPFPPSDYGWLLHSLKEKKVKPAQAMVFFTLC